MNQRARDIMKVLPILAVLLALIPLFLSGCQARVADGEQPHHEHPEQEGHEEHPKHRVIVTSPKVKDVVLTQEYVCQIHSRQHIEVRALVGGYLQEINIREGQRVKKGYVMFKILPVLYEAELNAREAELQAAKIKLIQSKQLYQKNFVSQVDVALKTAEVANAEAQMKLAQARLKFTDVKAPFDGIVDHQYEQLGSLIEEGDVLTTLSDNSVMWVYFNVPEAQYLEYMADLKKEQGQDQVQDDGLDGREAVAGNDVDYDGDAGGINDPHGYLGPVHKEIDLVLASGNKFPHAGKIGAIEAQFNNMTGNIHFRADFPNPEGLLRHGQSGTLLIHRTLKNATVIPRRATFEVLDRRYVYVVGKDDVVHPRELVVQNELDDIYVIKKGLEAGDKFVLEGVRHLRDGDKVEYEFLKPEASPGPRKVDEEE
jgi:membrane fusion protein (multidrug efflux system)